MSLSQRITHAPLMPLSLSRRLDPSQSLSLHPVLDVIFDPVLVPPLHWVHLDAVDLHGEMQVVARGEARRSALAHGLAARHHVAFLHAEFAQVTVNGLQTVAVIHDDAVAVNT